MHTVSRVFIRSIAIYRYASVLACVVLAITAAQALAVNVQLRVEGSGQTLFNGNVNTGPRTVAAEDLPGANVNFCDSDGAGDQNAANATPNTAVADSGLSYGTSGLRYGFGTAMCRIGNDETTATGSWTVKVNNTLGGGAVTGDTVLNEGDHVVWYFTETYGQPTFDLVLPAAAGVGQTVTGRVDKFDSGNDAQSPGAGATVAGGGASATAGGDGLFTITFSTPGHFLVSATEDGVVRGSAWIDVSTAPAALPAIAPVRINRFANCASRYGKGSPKHRRCVRIVRGKQRAECRGTDARVTAHCQKVLSRFKGRR